MVSLRRLARTSAAPSTLAHCGPWPAITPHWRHHGGVGGQLRAVEKRQSVCNDFKTSLVISTPWRQIEITDPHVECDPAPCFPAHSRRSTLEYKASPTQKKPDVAHADRWWPRSSSGRPHRQADADNWRGARGGEATTSGEPMRRSESRRSVKHVTIACCVSLSRGTTPCRKKQSSIAWAAWNCHPWRGTLGSGSSTVTPGRNKSAICSQLTGSVEARRSRLTFPPLK